jgi:hypothetical protein
MQHTQGSSKDGVNGAAEWFRAMFHKLKYAFESLGILLKCTF